MALRHQVSALIGEAPLEAKIPFSARFGVPGYHRNEKHAVADLAADLPIPGISTSEYGLVEPHLDTAGLQLRRDAAGGHRVLGGIADEDGTPVGLRSLSARICGWAGL